MRTMILSMTCGEGHNMIARAIDEQLKERGEDSKIVQLFGFDQKVLKKKNKEYLFILKHFPHIYDHIWNRLRRRNFAKPSRFVKNDTKGCAEYVLSQINEFHPDKIIATHPNAAIVLSEMKKHSMLDNITASAIVTDYCVHPYWELACGIDYVFSAMDRTDEELISRGFKKQQIRRCGLPASAKFKPAEDMGALRKKLGLEEGRFTVFIINGGAGVGNTLKLVKNILKENSDVALVCVNGRNEKSFKKIQSYIKKTGSTRITNLGFVTNVYEWVAACDMVISRGGAATLAENINCEKPMVLRENIIINEKVNKQILLEKQACLAMSKITDAGRLVRKLKEDEALRNSLVENTRALNNRSAAKDIVDALKSM